MNVLFDKATFEKSRAVKNEQSNELREPDTNEDDGKVVEDTIRNSIQSAKLGALTVDPGYLHFRTLERKHLNLIEHIILQIQCFAYGNVILYSQY